jgi:hypothetical protein
MEARLMIEHWAKPWNRPLQISDPRGLDRGIQRAIAFDWIDVEGTKEEGIIRLWPEGFEMC